MYNGIERISIPRNNINRLVKEVTIPTPHNTKNIKAKYSATSLPTASKSRPDSRKYINVAPIQTLLNSNPNLVKCNRLRRLILNKAKPLLSAILKTSNTSSATEATYLNAALFLMKMPLNIIITPKIADSIIVFIY
jgi:hypothetical protein